ncbi:MAG: ABC transporter ATP-binding protein [Lachnospiraceae bacterium]|nr:ABC transporter ATP-binding protein [Lachnospiraceae bacterium]
MNDSILELNHISKSFGSTHVLTDISLSVRKGELITLLGPSGCGKTTTLRIIAGLELPDAGQVFLNGSDVTESEPNKRNVNTVFQNYALFPHMNVADNIGYSLKLRKLPRAKIQEAVKEALALVQLSGYEKRYPSELSGGQRQRVAIARAVVNEPDVLLLDEPLGALDLQLRRQMQLELKRLQKKLGLTFIYITHDQEEALTMSDRIAVMKDGRLEQIGTPAEVYDTPRTAYVARFVGSANVLSGTALRMEGANVIIACEGGTVMADARGCSYPEGTPLTFAVRSEYITLAASPVAYGIPSVITEKSFAGGMLRIAAAPTSDTASAPEIIASRHGIDSELTPGDSVFICFDASNAVLVESDQSSLAPEAGQSKADLSSSASAPDKGGRRL